MGLLDRLAGVREDLLIAEIAALLHQLAKCSNGFIKSQLQGEPDYPSSYAVSLRELSSSFVKSSKYINWKNEKNSPFWEMTLTDLQRKAIQAMPFATNFENDSYSLLELLATWHRNHSDNFEQNLYQDWLDKGVGYFIWLLDMCHGAAHVEKLDLPDGKGNIRTGIPDTRSQSIGKTTVFGSGWIQLENKLNFPFQDLDALIKTFDFQSSSSNISVIRNSIIAQGNQILQKTISETRQPINEVTLWDWLWITSSLYKAYLARVYIQNKSIPINQNHFDLSWRTLRVTVDVIGILSKTYRIPDVLGYQKKLEWFFSYVKDLVEVCYPLGNEIYRDSSGIYFTFPDIESHDEIIKDISNRIGSLIHSMDCVEFAPLIQVSKYPWKELPGPLPQWLEATRILQEQITASNNDIKSCTRNDYFNIKSYWTSTEQSEICPVCGIHPLPKRSHEYREQHCHVCTIRASGVLSQWKSGEQFQGNMLERETIWLDEITDEYDRIAMIIGQFSLDNWLSGKMINALYGGRDKNGQQVFKEPSPARIMRVWRTTEEFWKNSFREVFQNKSLQMRKIISIHWISQTIPNASEQILDGEVEHMPISLFLWEDKTYLTIINPLLYKETLKEGAKVHLRNNNGPWYDGIITSISEPTQKHTTAALYYPVRTILTTPDQFLVLVPGQDALDLVRQIADQYTKEMGKVRSRLPMDLSIVYFHRKMPLYAAMDAARRFLQQKQTSSETWTVAQKHAHNEATPHQLESILLETPNTEKVTWSISTAFGDGTNDVFYPYVAVKQTQQQSDYTANGDEYIHISKLKAGDEIKVAPSHFSYLWLDNTTRRYSIGADDDAPFKTQGMYLEEIEQLTEMWNKLKAAKMTDTKLHGVIDVLIERYQAWNIGEIQKTLNNPNTDKDTAVLARVKKEIFEQFAMDVLKRNKLADFIKDTDVSNGCLFRCFDLFYRIMRQRLSSN